jgi:hypothetical protein
MIQDFLASTMPRLMACANCPHLLRLQTTLLPPPQMCGGKKTTVLLKRSLPVTEMSGPAKQGQPVGIKIVNWSSANWQLEIERLEK